MRRFAIQVLVILAIFFAAASPACQFISGTSSDLIEICTADGLVKTVLMPGGDQEQTDHAHKKDPCSFCFASSHIKPLTTATPVAPLPQTDEAGLQLAFIESSFIKRSELDPVSARAPPSHI